MQNLLNWSQTGHLGAWTAGESTYETKEKWAFQDSVTWPCNHGRLAGPAGETEHKHC